MKPFPRHIFIIHVILGMCIVVFLIFILLTNYVIFEENRLHESIYPNVYIDSIDAGRKTKQEMIDILNKRHKDLKDIHFTVLYKDAPVATFEADTLSINVNSKEVTEKAYLVGRTSRLSSRLYQKISAIFNLNKFYFTTSVHYDKEPLSQFIQVIEDQYNRPARNALFKFENDRVTAFSKEEYGLKVNSTAFYKQVDTLILKPKKNAPTMVVHLKDSPVEPEITLTEANSFNIEELIGVGVSNFSHSIPERIHNLTLATSKFQGILIPKDKVFSFNEAVGDISSLTGYKPAYIIKAGKTVLGDGGGVCQVSTTIFRAALNTGLPIVERHAHAYRVIYYENDSKPGFDATIFSPTIDLKFRNDTQGAILIQTEIDKENNLLYFRFYGKKDDRKIEISPVTISNEQPPLPALYQDDLTLKKGETRQVDFPAWGAKAVFNYKVTRGNEILQNETFVSNFRPWQAVYLVGKAD